MCKEFARKKFVPVLTNISSADFSDVDASLVEDFGDARVALSVGVVSHGWPGEIQGVQSDDRGLQQARARIHFLDLGQDGQNRQDDTHDHVKADEELVQGAVTLERQCI